MRYLAWIFSLTILYIGLTSNGEPLNWILGVLVATLVTLIIRPQPQPLHWQTLPQRIFGAVSFVFVSLWDLIKSSLLVGRLLLQKDIQLKQGVYVLPTGSDKQNIALLSAHAITLTPGELVVAIDDDNNLYTHALNVVDAQAVAVEAQERRVKQLEQLY